MIVTLFLMLENTGGEGGGAGKETCVEGCIGSSKVCGGCCVVGVGVLGQWRRRRSAELDGKLEVPHC